MQHTYSRAPPNELLRQFFGFELDYRSGGTVHVERQFAGWFVDDSIFSFLCFRSVHAHLLEQQTMFGWA